ncbi:hypothetical protein Nmel_008429 [Mimus melanotis]
MELEGSAEPPTAAARARLPPLPSPEPLFPPLRQASGNAASLTRSWRRPPAAAQPGAAPPRGRSSESCSRPAPLLHRPLIGSRPAPLLHRPFTGSRSRPCSRPGLPPAARDAPSSPSRPARGAFPQEESPFPGSGVFPR